MQHITGAEVQGFGTTDAELMAHLLVRGPQAKNELRGAEPALCVAGEERQRMDNHHCGSLNPTLGDVCEGDVLHHSDAGQLPLLCRAVFHTIQVHNQRQTESHRGSVRSGAAGAIAPGSSGSRHPGGAGAI